MARYFGHRTKWAGGTKYATPQGGPLAPRGSYAGGNRGISGQIIPPNRGQYPRGSSLPGYYRTPSSASSDVQAYARYRGYTSNLMMTRRFGPMAGKALGKLVPIAGLGLGLWETYQWWNTPIPEGSLIFPPGWTVNGCDRGLPRQKYWGNLDLSCTGVRVCTNPNQVVATSGPSWSAHVTEFLPSNGDPSSNVYRRNVTMRILQSVAGNPIRADMLPRVSTRTTPAPVNERPPRPQQREKGYSRPLPFVSAPSAVKLTPGGPKPVKPDFRPPLPGNWEKKAYALLTGPVGKAYGALTELGDAMDCLVGAIKGGKGSPGKTLQERAAYIVRNREKIDFPEFVMCMATQNFKDAVIGRVSGAADSITKDPYWRRPVGPSAGGWAYPRAPRMTPIR